ncbi:MAG: GYD domain-containing protein [Dehalococcoidia bacterium]|nr:GYD domain-containing protein [Dehalococcoidia bacterium]
MLFMSLLSPKGKGREAIDYLKKLKAPKGITIHDVYVTFGRYDGVVVFEAPNPKTAMSFVVDVGIETGYIVETLSAVPAKEV